MLTTSKKSAVVAGFVIVVAGVLLAGSRPGLRESLPFVGARFAEPSHSAEVVAADPATKQPVQPHASTPRGPGAADAQAPSSPAPRFDVVRVEPTGEMVLAGRGAPDTTIALLGDGRVLGEARTDAGGHFAMLPPALQAGDHALTLRQATEGASPVASRQSVAVSVPGRGKGAVVVALAEPGAATKVLEAPSASVTGQSPTATDQPSEPSSQSAAAPEPPATPTASPAAQALVVQSVELENGSGFYATGAAAPGTKLHLYLNNSHLADVAAAANGDWSVKIRKGLTGGHYVVRADGSTNGNAVTARAEVPFDVPLAMADARPGTRRPPDRPVATSAEPKPPASIEPEGGVPQQDLARAAAALPLQAPSARDLAAKPAEAHAIIEEITTTSVRAGDNLWDISRARLGEGRRYTRIFAANAAQIRDPRLIYPGQVFVLPDAGK